MANKKIVNVGTEKKSQFRVKHCNLEINTYKLAEIYVNKIVMKYSNIHRGLIFENKHLLCAILT